MRAARHSIKINFLEDVMIQFNSLFSGTLNIEEHIKQMVINRIYELTEKEMPLESHYQELNSRFSEAFNQVYKQLPKESLELETAIIDLEIFSQDYFYSSGIRDGLKLGWYLNNLFHEQKKSA
jgi:hypothetical protein